MMEGTKYFNRWCEYPLDIHIISVYSIDNEKKCEHELIQKFKSEFDFGLILEISNSKVMKGKWKENDFSFE
jgi:hypothetical protein